MLACRLVSTKAYYSSASKHAPCMVYGDVIFWNSIDNHNRTCERFIGKMSTYLMEGKVKDGKNTSDMATIDRRLQGYICS